MRFQKETDIKPIIMKENSIENKYDNNINCCWYVFLPIAVFFYNVWN